MSNREQFSIARRIEIDAAHRVPHHGSKCFNVHGHRYVIEATCTGDLIPEGEQTGMVMDFSFLKDCMIEAIHKPCDHGIIFWREDDIIMSIDTNSEGWKVLLLPDVPTAENLAKYWYFKLRDEIRAWFRHRDLLIPTLASITVWETPNCKATYPWHPRHQ